MDTGKLEFCRPLNKYSELLKEFEVNDLLDLRDKLKSSNNKEKRELLYGIIFSECLNQISKNEYLIRLPNEDADCDFEILDYTQYNNNQKTEKNQRVPDHWRCQNVMINEYPTKDFLKKGVDNIYDIFAQHLNNKKLSFQKGDYSGCILIFYIGLNINGWLDLKEIRRCIRNVKQSKVQQIYIIAPYLKESVREFTIAEVLMSDSPASTVNFLKNLN